MGFEQYIDYYLLPEWRIRFILVITIRQMDRK